MRRLIRGLEEGVRRGCAPRVCLWGSFAMGFLWGRLSIVRDAAVFLW